MDAVDRYSAYYGWLLYGGTLKLQTNEIVIYIRRNTTLTYRAPDYLRWEYKTPTQLVWELDANKSNVSPQIQRLLKMIMLTIAADNFENSTDFSVRVEEGIYHLTPKNREIKQFFSLIQIEIDPTNGVAKQVTLTEKSGDISTITFYNVCL